MPAARPGGDGLPFVYAGTMIVQGQGSAAVVAIGAHTEFGRIGKALQSIDATPTRLQRETGAVVRRIGGGAFSVCAGGLDLRIHARRLARRHSGRPDARHGHGA